MACTLTVRDDISFVSAMIKQQRLNVNNLEPGLGMANIILERILGPPFVWRFNRSTFPIAISAAGGTDYQVTVQDLGRIETQWLEDSAGIVTALEGAISLAPVSASKRPTQVAPQYDDNAGTITFRFNAVPEKNYTAYFDYQRKAPLLTSYGSLWAPIPDEYSFLHKTGLLSWAGALVNDQRTPIWEKYFIGGVLGAQDGLDEQQKALFIDSWMTLTGSVQRKQGAVQGGVAGRGT